MKLADYVRVSDAGIARLRTKAGAIVAGRPWEPKDEKSVVEVKGWVTACLRERGKIVPGSKRDGHNIWTNTGREFLAMLMSLESAMTPYRQDRVAYIGVGIGSRVEEAGVLSLVNPTEYASGIFLAPLDIPPTFPLTPTRTTVKYHRVFSESEITLSAGSRVNISEIGLFTNGSPLAVPPYNPGTRDLTIAQAAQQAPVAYKSFEPLGKTDGLELEVSWEIRF